MDSVPTFTGITHTGQVIIPPSIRNFSISVISGQATINGVVAPAPYAITINLPDSKVIMGTNQTIAVGATGLGNRVIVYFNN